MFGSAVMGYGDLFIAGVLGGLLAVTMGRSLQWRGARLTGCWRSALTCCSCSSNELPATVPVALALILLSLGRRRASLGG